MPRDSPVEYLNILIFEFRRDSPHQNGRIVANILTYCLRSRWGDFSWSTIAPGMVYCASLFEFVNIIIYCARGDACSCMYFVGGTYTLVPQ